MKPARAVTFVGLEMTVLVPPRPDPMKKQSAWETSTATVQGPPPAGAGFAIRLTVDFS